MESQSFLDVTCQRWVRRPGLQFWTALLVGQVIALGSTTQLYVNWAASGMSPSFWGLLLGKSLEFALWAAAVPLVVRFDAGLDWSRGWLRPAGMHLVLATALFLLLNAPVTAVLKLGRESGSVVPFFDQYVFRLSYRLLSAWVTYTAILAGARLIQEFVHSRQLARDLDETRMEALRAQLQPHFLFNALHTAGSLVRSGDREGAVTTLAALADLLRRSIRNGDRERVSLGEELDFLSRYLAIQRRRFGQRMSVEIDVPTSLRNAAVPAFLIQPLVENAVRHGLDLDESQGQIWIDAERVGSELRIRVADSGGGFARLPEHGSNGSGLTNLRRRLQTRFGDRAGVEARASGGRSIVTVTLPFAEDPE